ncbi:glycerol-3-phosphate 1-O-acyltransferase PlsY [Roseomonas sp. WA12]
MNAYLGAPLDTVALAAAVGFLLGSIPFGLLLTRAAGLGDIRTIGSGNIGATNVLRTGNKKLAAATLALDFLKGAAAVGLVAALLGPNLAGAAAVGAVLGHCHPPWLGFRGGKGVATALGVFLGLAWPVFLAAALTWLVMAKLVKISSASALTGLMVAAVVAFLWGGAGLFWPVALIVAYVYFRHHENIARLIAGTEPRIGQGK